MSRLVVVLVLLFGVAGVTYAFAKWHPARPGNAASAPVQLGDQYRGETVFQGSCAGCHGPNGSGGVGPKLRGLAVTIARVKAQIDNGGGTMPAGIVKGGDEKDVLAYVNTLITSRLHDRSGHVQGTVPGTWPQSAEATAAPARIPHAVQGNGPFTLSERGLSPSRG